MGMNHTPRSVRTHIGFFGRRNAGKSSLINALTNQQTAVVSPIKGTTTDPVYKAMELLPLGPVVMIDTAGIDDNGELGELRVQKTLEVLAKTDLAIVVFEHLSTEQDLVNGDLAIEMELLQKLKDRNIPIIGVLNKADANHYREQDMEVLQQKLDIKLYPVSATDRRGILELKQAIADLGANEQQPFSLVGDLISAGDVVVLVVPIDTGAPKGRLILPQQQTIRDILECDGIAVVTKEHQLKETLGNLSKTPKLVITDSQVFSKVAEDTPEDIALTSFSILFARNKGNLEQLLLGAMAVDSLQDGDKILVAEACTHHQQVDDIGTVKIPRWLRQRTGKLLQFEHVSGKDFGDQLQQYALVIHCGGCMLNRPAMENRIRHVAGENIPIVNYGILIAYMQGILERAIMPFPSASITWQERR